MNIQQDLRYLKATLPELESYLLSESLYYPLQAGLPQLTLGSVLLAQTKAGIKAEQLSRQIDSIRSKWASAWSAKAGRELKSRGGLWREYLAEYRHDPKLEFRLYPQNVHNRAIMSLLGQTEDETDAFLRSVFITGNFVWEKEYAENFPRHTFWYLFGSLKE